MEFIIIVIVSIITLLILGIVFDYNLNKIKNIAKDKKLDEISKKYPNNITICKKYLKMLKNENVKIEENKDSEASLYIAITNKISIANINNTYTRIQTIAHECLHSIQDRKILITNFIFSNIYIIYFIVICLLGLVGIMCNKMLVINIYLLLSLIYYMIRIYLENDAMIKARYLAKEYLENENISDKNEIDDLVNGFDKINSVGIKCINFKFFFDIIIRMIIICIIFIIR